MRRLYGGAARRYARALLEVATQTAQEAAVRDELRGVVAVLDGHHDLATVLTSPAVSADARRRVVGAAFGRQASALVVRLLTLLAERGKIALLPALEKVYTELWNAQRGVLSADATTAVPMSVVQRSALAEAIRNATGLGAEIEAAVDPAILGGVRLRMGGRTYDGTVLARMRGLRERLAGASHA